MSKIKCALIVGHSKKSQGSSNEAQGITEYMYNEDLAVRIKDYVSGLVDIDIVYRDTYKGLPDKVNALNPDFVVSLHCNAFNKEASGTETLYYHSSKKGKEIAKLFQNRLVLSLELNNRGIKPKHSEDKGGYLLKYVKAPCVILEPFFIDNNSDLEKGLGLKPNLAQNISYAIQKIGMLWDE